MEKTKESPFNKQREKDGRPLDAKEELFRRMLALRHEVEKFLDMDMFKYDSVLTDLSRRISRLESHIMRQEASDVTAQLDDINQQLETYRAQASNP